MPRPFERGRAEKERGRDARDATMADKTRKVAENSHEPYYVDVTCIDCDLCRETAPANFVRQDDAGHSYVVRQPRDPAEEAACLAADMARASKEAILRQAATQALPILRNASANNADPITRDAARRRLGVISDVLHTLGTQQFGKRQTDPKPLAPAERYRQMLGLPLGRRLSGVEIHQAYKRLAKRVHPDAGGNAREFQELSAARDALMKERPLR